MRGVTQIRSPEEDREQSKLEHTNLLLNNFYGQTVHTRAGHGSVRAGFGPFGHPTRAHRV
jgi:hypothetical protein